MKSGFVNIIGNPNVGKSTLMNALVGQRLSIITSKAQTTRHRIFGILNGDNHQIVFSDTPGVIIPSYSLQEKMMGFVNASFEDADVLLYVVEAGEKTLKDGKILDRIRNHSSPLIIAMNKIDAISQQELEEYNQYWIAEFPNAEIIPISALKNFQTEYLLQRLIELVPEAPPYFDKETLTDRSERFFASEIIREKILIQYDKEVPYSCEVGIDTFKDEGHRIHIRAIIYVARDSQKGIIIGHKGQSLSNLGRHSRKELDAFFGKPTFLELFVKVNKDWRQNERQLKNFGYNS